MILKLSKIDQNACVSVAPAENAMYNFDCNPCHNSSQNFDVVQFYDCDDWKARDGEFDDDEELKI